MSSTCHVLLFYIVKTFVIIAGKITFISIVIAPVEEKIGVARYVSRYRN